MNVTLPDWVLRGFGQSGPRPEPAAAPSPPSEHGAMFLYWRKKAGLSIAVAAKLCGVDPSTVFRWEKNRQAHTHRAKQASISAGIELMRWAAERRERGDRELTVDELVVEAARQRLAKRAAA